MFCLKNRPIGRLNLMVVATIICIEAAALPPGQLHTASVNDALNDGDSLLLLYRQGYGVPSLA